MSKVILAICLAGAGWWYFYESRTLTKSNIEGFYAQMNVAIGEMDTEKLCGMMTVDFKGVITYADENRVRELHQDKDDACDSYDQMKDAQRKLRKVGRPEINTRIDVYGFDLSKNKQEASVDLRYSMNLGGVVGISMMGTDTLIRKNGKVMVKHSEARPVGNGL